MYAGLIGASFGLLVPIATDGQPWALLGLGAAIVAVAPIKAVQEGAHGRELITVLGATGKVQLAYGALVTIGMVLSA